jgi:hypothetical protein
MRDYYVYEEEDVNFRVGCPPEYDEEDDDDCFPEKDENYHGILSNYDREYYYRSIYGDRKGPFTLSELEFVNEVDPSTLMWYKGLAKWVRADSLPELSDILILNQCEMYWM